MYVLTPEGMKEKINLTINFMRRQMQEYDELKKELEDQNIKVEEIKKNSKIKMLNNKTVLVTGATGSFGKEFVSTIIKISGIKN